MKSILNNSFVFINHILSESVANNLNYSGLKSLIVDQVDNFDAKITFKGGLELFEAINLFIFIIQVIVFLFLFISILSTCSLVS